MSYEGELDHAGDLECGIYEALFWISKEGAVRLIKLLKEEFNIKE